MTAGVTSMKLNGLELIVPGVTDVGQATLLALEARPPHTGRYLTMAGETPPHYVGTTTGSLSIPLNVAFLRKDAFDRQADYDALAAVCDMTGGALKVIEWTDTAHGTRHLNVHIDGLVPSMWFENATSAMVAPDPRAY